MRRFRVVIGVLVVGLGVVGWLVPAAGAFTFRSAPGSPYTDGNPPIAVAVGDFTGNGLSDFVIDEATPIGNPSRGAMWLADGSGGFAPYGGTMFGGGQFTLGGASMAVGDVNGDGKLDLVAATAEAGSSPDDPVVDGVTVLLGNGNGTFTPAPGSPIAVGGTPLDVALGDFNGDGKPDLAALLSNDTMAVLLGNGDGTFTPAPGSPIALGAGNPSAIAVGDFTGSGKLDLAVTNQTQGTVSVLLGNGDGTFTPAPGSPITVGGTPPDLAVGDFTGDGRDDLVVQDAPTGGLTVLLGHGDGTFSPAPGSPIMLSGQLLPGLAVADFNEDGNPDIAVGSSAGLDLLLGDGSGRFRPAGGSPFAEGQDSQDPAVLASGPFDGRTGVFLGSGAAVALLLAPLPSDPPAATLAASATRTTTGQPVTLNASGSSDPLDRPIVDYRWDLGNGRFSHDTGTTPTLTTTFHSAGTFPVRVQVTNTAGETAIATITLSVQPPPPKPRTAVVAGYVRVCGGPASRRCAKRAIRICKPARRCVISDRVAAVNAQDRVVTTQKLNRGHFRMRLAPGRYTIKLLGDSKRVHGRVLQRRKTTARANHTTTIRFSFTLPKDTRA